MSDDGGSDKEPITEADLAREIEDKCYKAFITFDQEGSGGEVKSDDIHKVLDHMEIKMSDDEVYKTIAEIDPENTGSI